MVELELIVIQHTRDQVNRLQELLKRFSAEKRIKVNLNALGWDIGWREIVQIAIHRRGADVSEVGTTWIADLAGMNALRPVNRIQIGSLGGEEQYLPASWKSCLVSETPGVW